MALITCSECSAPMSDKATSCPKCGKKYSPDGIWVVVEIGLFLVGMLILTFLGYL